MHIMNSLKVRVTLEKSVCRIECMNVNVGSSQGFERVWCVLSFPKNRQIFSLSLSLSFALSLSINPSFYFLHFTQSSQTLEGVRITALRLYSLTQLCCFIHEQTERFREERLKKSVNVLVQSDLLLNCCVIVMMVCAPALDEKQEEYSIILTF